MINHNSHVPLYVQVSEHLENAIRSSYYKDGEKLPSENQLCKEYEVSRITVRQALSGLEQKGLLYSVHGKGTYVSLSKIEQGLMKITLFEKTLEEKGMKGFTRIEKYGRTDVPLKVSLMFGRDNVSCLRLVGYSENSPLVYYNSYLSGIVGDQVYEIAREKAADGKAFSTLDIFKELALSGLDIEQKLTAISAGKSMAAALQVERGVPLLKIETFAYKDTVLIEYKEAYYRADKYAFTIKRHMD